ncbi:MAG: hypothetical protein PHN56_03920 [Candidatus Nanoarchaeia archaeon]|nr:hypothetical protein [Candidatus Nanoarchaeia archaeon]
MKETYLNLEDIIDESNPELAKYDPSKTVMLIFDNIDYDFNLLNKYLKKHYNLLKKTGFDFGKNCIYNDLIAELIVYDFPLNKFKKLLNNFDNEKVSYSFSLETKIYEDLLDFKIEDFEEGVINADDFFDYFDFFKSKNIEYFSNVSLSKAVNWLISSSLVSYFEINKIIKKFGDNNYLININKDLNLLHESLRMKSIKILCNEKGENIDERKYESLSLNNRMMFEMDSFYDFCSKNNLILTQKFVSNFFKDTKKSIDSNNLIRILMTSSEYLINKLK